MPAAPRPVIKKMTLVHQYGIMSAPTTSQYAAVEALRYGDNDIEDMRMGYDRRRKLILAGLREMGLSCFEPIRCVLHISGYFRFWYVQ